MPLLSFTGITNEAVQQAMNTFENTTDRVVDRIDDRVDLGVLENNIDNVGTAGAEALEGMGHAATVAATTHAVGTGAGILMDGAQLINNLVHANRGRAQTGDRFGVQMDLGINQSNPAQSLANCIQTEAAIIVAQTPNTRRHVVVVPVGVNRMIMASIRSLPTSDKVEQLLLPPCFIGGYMSLQAAVNDVTSHMLQSHARREKPEEEESTYAFVFYDLQRTTLFKTHRANFPRAMFRPNCTLRFISAATAEKPFDRFDVRSTIGDTEATRLPIVLTDKLSQDSFVNFAYSGPERIFGLGRWMDHFRNWSFIPAASSAVVEGAAIGMHHGLWTFAAAHLHIVAHGTCIVGAAGGLGLSATLGGAPALIYGVHRIYGTTVWQTEEEIARMFALCERYRLRA